MHWVAYIRENWLDSYGCSSPNKLSKLIIKRIGHCLISEYNIQNQTRKRDSWCPKKFSKNNLHDKSYMN